MSINRLTIVSAAAAICATTASAEWVLDPELTVNFGYKFTPEYDNYFADGAVIAETTVDTRSAVLTLRGTNKDLGLGFSADIEIADEGTFITDADDEVANSSAILNSYFWWEKDQIKIWAADGVAHVDPTEDEFTLKTVSLTPALLNQAVIAEYSLGATYTADTFIASIGTDIDGQSVILSGSYFINDDWRLDGKFFSLFPGYETTVTDEPTDAFYAVVASANYDDGRLNGGIYTELYNLKSDAFSGDFGVSFAPDYMVSLSAGYEIIDDVLEVYGSTRQESLNIYTASTGDTLIRQDRRNWNTIGLEYTQAENIVWNAAIKLQETTCTDGEQCSAVWIGGDATQLSYSLGLELTF